MLGEEEMEKQKKVGDHEMVDENMEESGSEEESESEDSDDGGELDDGDHLEAEDMDIPRVSGIKKISMANPDKEVKRTGGLQEVMEAEEQDLETHFVENPFIKIRERALAKKRSALSEV